MELSEAIRLFVESKVGIRSRNTLSWYQRMLGPMLAFLGDVQIEEINLDDLRRWRASLVRKGQRWATHPGRPTVEGGLSSSTLRSYVRACRIFFNWLEEEGKLEKTPARRLEFPPQAKGEAKKDISQEDALLILKAAKYHPRDYSMLMFLADTGCRAEGLLGLRIGDLNGLEPDDLGFYRAVVREKGQGDQYKARTVYFTLATAGALARYMEVRPEARTDLVFLGQRRNGGRPALRHSGLYQMIKRYAGRAGVTGCWNPHAWRHAFAHNLLDKGVDVGAVSQFLGHSSVVITIEFYGQRGDRQLADIHAKSTWVGGVGG